MSLSAICNENSLIKYMSAKKPPAPFYEVPGFARSYKNYLISAAPNIMYMVDINTGQLVKTIAGSYTLSGGNSKMAHWEVVDENLMIYYTDSTIQQWDLESGEIARELRPSRSGAFTRNCAYDLPHDTLYCCINSGFLRIINMANGRITTEFNIHVEYCSVRINGSYVYTSSTDGTMKRFDLAGNLLNTYDLPSDILIFKD
ncbi:hypothetical protein MP638_005037 [Amoeboaphelidium occidentale]|nr:hypothetical protein MP638_005037 [Amoeboaphelidium occidentale]